MFKINFKKYKIFKKHKIFAGYASLAVLLVLLIYLIIPFFFNYSKFKNILQDKIFLNFGTKIIVAGDIKYHFLPTPRLRIKDLKIKDYIDENKDIGKVDIAILKIPFKKLMRLKEINFNNVTLIKSDVILDFESLSKYKIFFEDKFKSKPIEFSKSKFTLKNNDKKIFSISDMNLVYRSSEISDEVKLNGKFFNDNISINFQNKKKSKTPAKILLIKLDRLGFNLRLNSFVNSDDYSKGNFTLRYLNNRLASDYIFKNSNIQLIKANFNNSYFKGEIAGNIELDPFLYFDLSADIKRFNFKKILNFINNLSAHEQVQLFNINKIINGKLLLDINKIYSSSKLIQSAETELEFRNKDIIINKLLLDLGRIGASDVNGKIVNDPKYIKLYFDQNIYLDNNKIFFNRFNLKNVNNVNNVNINGEINLSKFLLKLNSIRLKEKINSEDLNFVEKTFNEILFEEHFNSLFNYTRLKEFFDLVIG